MGFASDNFPLKVKQDLGLRLQDPKSLLHRGVRGDGSPISSLCPLLLQDPRGKGKPYQLARERQGEGKSSSDKGAQLCLQRAFLLFVCPPFFLTARERTLFFRRTFGNVKSLRERERKKRSTMVKTEFNWPGSWLNTTFKG